MADVLHLDHHAGAAAFDRVSAEIGRISESSFNASDREDWAAMVALLESAMRDAMQRSQAYRAGFLLPMVNAMECQRMGLIPGDEWTGGRVLLAVVQGGTELPA